MNCRGRVPSRLRLAASAALAFMVACWASCAPGAAGGPGIGVGGLTLEDAVLLAVSQSPEMTAARKALESSGAALDAAESAFGWRLVLSRPPARMGLGASGGLVALGGEDWEPKAWQAGATLSASHLFDSGGSLALSASYDTCGWFEPGPEPGFPAAETGERWTFGARVEQPIGDPLGEAAVFANRSARISVDQATASLRSAARSAALSAASAFYGVARADASLATARRNADMVARTLGVIREKARSGNASSLEVQDGEISLARARLNVSAAENALVLARQALARAVGLPIKEAPTIEVTGPEVGSDPGLGFLPEVPASLDECASRALATRPEVAAAQVGVSGAELAVASERADAGFRPKAVLTWSDGSGWVVGLDATWDILDGGAARAKMREKQARLDQARLQLASAREAVVQDVTRCYLDRSQALSAVEVARMENERAVNALRTTEERAAAGASTYLDVLKALDEVRDSEAALANAFYDVCLAEAKLRLAVEGMTK